MDTSPMAVKPSNGADQAQRSQPGTSLFNNHPQAEEYLVSNETPRRLEVELRPVQQTGADGQVANAGGDNRMLVLAPLQTRRVPKEIWESEQLQPWLDRNVLAKIANPPAGLPSYILQLAMGGFGIGIWYLIAIPFVAWLRSDWYPQVWIGLPIFFLPFVGAVTFHYVKERIDPRMIGQLLSLVLILGIGVGLPALGIYFFGEGELLFTDLSSLTLLGRVLQLAFISIVALLPALLFFLFDRQQLRTLRSRFNHQIFRLDPTVKTLTEVRAKYGEELKEIYGPEDASNNAARLLGDTRWPILVATLVITLGWIVTLLPVRGAVTINKADDLHSLFVPQTTAIIFAFLGAYFFALNTILRRYLRGDLRPKAYTSITVRIITVVILAWVLELIFSGRGHAYLMTLVFLIGIFPETGLTLIREYLRVGPSLKEEHPLTKLEGIDLYDRARLMDEGVTNVESLAHHELIDLMLQTRVPVPRLVDWVDQAILYLHLPDGRETGENGASSEGLRQSLHQCGVRTATDLEQSWESVEKYFQARNDSHELNRLRAVKDALKDDEWMPYIRHWRFTGSSGQEDRASVTDPNAFYALPKMSASAS